MSTVDKEKELEFLRTWQSERLREYRNNGFDFQSGPKDVTVLSYFYRSNADIVESFSYLECAIYETWRHCGIMKTVIVTNENSSSVKEFADKWVDAVEIQVEPNLVPGSLDPMSIDCNSKLYQRFNTKYVLIVQDDGFPLRSGLEDFIGKADYFGSPFRRRTWKGMLASSLFRHCPANGGFSLRTRKICELAAKYWNRFYRDRKFTAEQVEDIFYTDTLPRRFWKYRLAVKMANPRLAAQFSYDGCVPENIIDSPFGFHSARAFAELIRDE